MAFFISLLRTYVTKTVSAPLWLSPQVLFKFRNYSMINVSRYEDMVSYMQLYHPKIYSYLVSRCDERVTPQLILLALEVLLDRGVSYVTGDRLYEIVVEILICSPLRKYYSSLKPSSVLYRTQVQVLMGFLLYLEYYGLLKMEKHFVTGVGRYRRANSQKLGDLHLKHCFYLVNPHDKFWSFVYIGSGDQLSDAQLLGIRTTPFKVSKAEFKERSLFA